MNCSTKRAENHIISIWQLAALSDFRLASFDDKKIQAFAQGWYAGLVRSGQVSQSDAGNLARALN